MTRKINHFALIGTLLVSACVMDEVNTRWVDDFTSRWVDNLNYNINNMVRQINTKVASLTEEIERNVEQTIKNLPKDAQGNIIGTNGSSIISTSSIDGTKFMTIIDGESRIITSGHKPNGEPYVRSIVEKRVGDMLYHNETTFNPKTGATETIAWKLNLAVPGAKPEIITDTEKDEK